MIRRRLTTLFAALDTIRWMLARRLLPSFARPAVDAALHSEIEMARAVARLEGDMDQLRELAALLDRLDTEYA